MSHESFTSTFDSKELSEIASFYSAALEFYITLGLHMPGYSVEIIDGKLRPLETCCLAIFKRTGSQSRFEVQALGSPDCLNKIGQTLESEHTLNTEAK